MGRTQATVHALIIVGLLLFAARSVAAETDPEWPEADALYKGHQVPPVPTAPPVPTVAPVPPVPPVPPAPPVPTALPVPPAAREVAEEVAPTRRGAAWRDPNPLAHWKRVRTRPLEERMDLYKELRSRRDPAAAWLLQGALLYDPLPEGRVAAAKSLKALGLPHTRAALRLAAFNDPNAWVQREATSALLFTSSDYRSARRMRSAGIIITAAGGGAGLLALVAAATSSCDDGWFSPSCDTRKRVMVAGGVTMGVSLIVGILVGVTGSKRMDQARARTLRPDLSVAVGPDQARLSARWSL